MVVLRAILGELTAALVPTIARALDATIAADQTVIAVLAAIGLVLSRSRSRLMLNAPVATDQSVVSICPPIWLIGWTRSRNVVVPPAVRAEIPIGVVSAIRTVVSVSARMVAVVVGVVPSVVVDVSVVVVNDRGRTATAATSPVHSPGIPFPPYPATPTPAAKHRADRDATTKVETNRRNWYWRRHVKRYYDGRAEHDGRVVLRDIDNLRVRWLDHDGGRRRLRDGDLRTRLQGTGRLRLRTHRLYCRHHIILLIRERLPEARRPREVMSQVVQH